MQFQYTTFPARVKYGKDEERWKILRLKLLV